MYLIHASCGGRLVVDISPLMIAKVPSLTFDGQNFSISMIELEWRKKPQPPLVVCTSCGKSSSLENEEKILTVCNICQCQFPLSKIYVTRETGCICENCKDVLSGKIKKGVELSGRIKIAYDVYYLPKETIISKLAEVLKTNLLG